MAGTFQLPPASCGIVRRLKKKLPGFPCCYFLCTLSIIFIVILSALDFFLSKREHFITFLLRVRKSDEKGWDLTSEVHLCTGSAEGWGYHHPAFITGVGACTLCHSSAWHHLPAAEWCSEGFDRCLNARALLSRGLGALPGGSNHTCTLLSVDTGSLRDLSDRIWKNIRRPGTYILFSERPYQHQHWRNCLVIGSEVAGLDQVPQGCTFMRVAQAAWHTTTVDIAWVNWKHRRYLVWKSEPRSFTPVPFAFTFLEFWGFIFSEHFSEGVSCVGEQTVLKSLSSDGWESCVSVTTLFAKPRTTTQCGHLHRQKPFLPNACHWDDMPY